MIRYRTCLSFRHHSHILRHREVCGWTFQIVFFDFGEDLQNSQNHNSSKTKYGH